jgi:hypothetical protein
MSMIIIMIIAIVTIVVVFQRLSVNRAESVFILFRTTKPNNSIIIFVININTRWRTRFWF